MPLSLKLRHWRLPIFALFVGGCWCVVGAQEKPGGSATAASPDPADWSNPGSFAVGALPASASGYPFETREKAIVGHRTKSTRFLLLSGDWQFYYSPDANHKPIGFERPDYDASRWNTIKVPADWQSQGYGRVSSAIPALLAQHGRPQIAAANNPVGSYRREVDVPDDWSGSDVTMEIAGAGSAYAVWVNGNRVGFSQDGRLPSDFDVTHLIHPGRNIFAIQVYRWSSGSFLEGSDVREASGIDREVILVAVPKMRIRDFFVHAGLDQHHIDGKLAVDFAITPGSAATASFSLLDAEMREILTRITRINGAANERDVTLCADVPGVHAWSAESPYLYKILLELRDAGGMLLQSTYARVGFRTIAVRRGQLIVNGRAVMLRGAVRRERDGISLHFVSGSAMDRDLLRMKQSGVNAIRTGHPNDAHFYELTDRYGFYVVDEPNLDGREMRRWRIGMISSRDERWWRAAQMSRVMNLAARDKNHPSIIAWSMGADMRRDASAAITASAVAGRDPDRLIVCCRNLLERAWASHWNTPVTPLPSPPPPASPPASTRATAPTAARKEKQ